MPSESSLGTQARAAQCMYNRRAAEYENSWHPQYSRRFMELVDIKPGDRVLDLACGTGLKAIPAAYKAGDDGGVVAIDIAANMLFEMKKKLDADAVLARRINVIQHNITDLASCDAVERGSFDWIICSNAFVLLENSEQVLAQWHEYLKPDGRVVIDIPHEKNLLPGILLERVAHRLRIKFPSSRLWIKSIDSFRDMLEGQGFEVEKALTLEKQAGKGTTYSDLDQADEQFDYVLNGPVGGVDGMDELRSNGRAYFKEEWERAAVDGKLESSDILYVYFARKA